MKEEMKYQNNIKKEDRIDKINYYLDIAETVAERSTCLKRKYGAIIVNNDEIISTGYNGAPRGIISCLQEGKCNRNNSERGKDYSLCKSVHAEQNAIISASRKNMIGADIYIVGLQEDTYVENPAPCSLCKRMIINSGIKSVFIRTDKTKYEICATKDWTDKDIIGGY